MRESATVNRASVSALPGNARKAAAYQRLRSAEPYRAGRTAKEAARRSLRNCCLHYLLAVAPGETADQNALALGIEQHTQADNMTDAAAALSTVVNADRAAGDALLAKFYEQWQHDPLVVDKWLALQAGCIVPGTLAHPAFSLKNPNKVRTLIGTFCANQQQFHAADGSGYAFLAERIEELDPMNPQVAARILTPLTQWRRYDAARQQLMRQTLEQIAALPGLSRDVSEVVSKSLQGS